MVWDVVALAYLIHPDSFEPRQARIDYIVGGTGDPHIVPASIPHKHARIDIPEHRADVEVFWEWALSKL